MNIQKWVSFQCYYENGNKTIHRQQLPVEQIPKWIEAYKFTHPDCISITVKVWFEEVNNNG